MRPRSPISVHAECQATLLRANDLRRAVCYKKHGTEQASRAPGGGLEAGWLEPDCSKPKVQRKINYNTAYWLGV